VNGGDAWFIREEDCEAGGKNGGVYFLKGCSAGLTALVIRAALFPLGRKSVTWTIFSNGAAVERLGRLPSA